MRIFCWTSRRCFLTRWTGRPTGSLRRIWTIFWTGAGWTLSLIHISPGLTGAVPIARRVVRMMAEREELTPNPDFNPRRKGIARFAEASEEEQKRLIEENPDYGELICRCEKVTKAEILQAIHNPLGVHTLVGLSLIHI